MAKRKIRNIKLEQNELQSTTIGMFESRKKSSLGTFFVLTIFVLVIIFLPQISDFIKNYLHKESTPSIIDNNNSTPNNIIDNNTENNDDDYFYEYIENLQIINDDITVDNFNIDLTNLLITYRVTNNKASIDIETLNYYLEIYNQEKTLLERIKLASTSSLSNNESITITHHISSDAALNIGYLALIKKTILDYPEVNLNIDADGQSTLTCVYNNEVVSYQFTDYKLTSLTSEINHTTSEEDYLTELFNNQNLVSSYNSHTGITSLISESANGYNITTNVNLSEVARTYIFNADTFKLNTEPKVVKFEMEAQGFKCR